MTIHRQYVYVITIHRQYTEHFKLQGRNQSSVHVALLINCLLIASLVTTDQLGLPSISPCLHTLFY